MGLRQGIGIGCAIAAVVGGCGLLMLMTRPIFFDPKATARKKPLLSSKEKPVVTAPETGISDGQALYNEMLARAGVNGEVVTEIDLYEGLPVEMQAPPETYRLIYCITGDTRRARLYPSLVPSNGLPPLTLRGEQDAAGTVSLPRSWEYRITISLVGATSARIGLVNNQKMERFRP